MIAKRIFDLFFAAVGLILLLPVFLILAAWIKLDSAGPVFFRQVRVGRFGVGFKIFKFRTMFVDSEKNGQLITVGSDLRITHAGSFIRRYKLDELPQLLNVVLGEMSLVGPRPEVPCYVEIYPEEIRKLVLSVRPGITDYASIEFKDENTILGRATDPVRAYIDEVIPSKLRYCERYVRDRSIWIDINIIIKTLIAIVK